MAVLWPFEPNWSTPVTESLEWYTDVQRAYNGTEKRLSLRSIARRRLAYDFLVRHTDTQLFDNLLWGRQNQPFVVPYWQYRELTTAAVSIGATSIPVDTSTAGYAAGQSIVIFLNALVNEVRTIASVTTGHVIVTVGTALAWPAGSKVYPASVSLFESNVPVKRHTSSVLEGTATFLAEPISTDPFVPAASAPDTYLGVEVILKQPDWVNPIDRSATFNFDVVDYSTGDRLSAATELNQSLMFQYRWVLKSRPLVNDFRAFLGRRKGQFKTVYLPSWHEDFTLAANIASGDTTITVIDRFFSLYVGINPARSNLMIRTRTHGNFLRPITSFTTSGANVVITITTSLGVAVPISDVLSISYLCLYRKATDLSTFQWQTDRVAIVEDSFQLVAA